MGSLDIIVGNMFSGKTTELMRRINRESSIQKRILVVNYIDDNRYSMDSITSHDSVSIKSKKVKLLHDLFELVDIHNFDSIFIDEAQFFDDLLVFCTKVVDTFGKNVTVCGLDGDFNRNPFGEILDLIPLCDSIVKLKAYCKVCADRTLAPFTQRIDCKNDIIDIGGSDKYIPVCRKHYINLP
jgi:thymidine kinase